MLCPKMWIQLLFQKYGVEERIRQSFDKYFTTIFVTSPEFKIIWKQSYLVEKQIDVHGKRENCSRKWCGYSCVSQTKWWRNHDQDQTTKNNNFDRRKTRNGEIDQEESESKKNKPPIFFYICVLKNPFWFLLFAVQKELQIESIDSRIN